MSSSMLSSSPNKASQSSVCLVKYYGRDVALPPEDPMIGNCLRSLKKCLDDISSISSKSNSPDRNNLKDSLLRMVSFLSNPDIEKKLYRVDILNEALLPYIQSMKGNYTLDPQRYSQVTFLLDILSDSETVYNNGSQGVEFNSAHPAITCQHIDKLIANINSNQYWTKSSLARNLEQAVTKQWRPILADNRRAIQSIGVRFAVLGLVEAVGRPVAMLYPLWLILQEVLIIVKSIESKQQVSPQTILSIIKAVLLLIITSYILSILTMYQGMGYTCLALGIASLSLSLSDSNIKAIAPIISPHLAHLDAFIDKISSLESSAFKMVGFGGTNSSQSSSNMSAETIPDHPQVEELSQKSNMRDANVEDIDEDDEVDDEVTSNGLAGDSGGMRRRIVPNASDAGVKSSTWTSSKNK